MNLAFAQLLLAPRLLLAPLLALYLMSCGTSAKGAKLDMAVLGDSLSTGAATHPNLTYDALGLWNIFTGEVPVVAKAEDIPAADRFGLQGTLQLPLQAWPTSREFVGGFNWVFHHAILGVSRLYLNTEQYSWGYMVAAELGIPADRFLLAAENGARTGSMPRQIDRVLEYTGGNLPAKMFLFFTGNDLCGPTLNFVTTTEDYRASLERSLQYLVRNGRAAPQGTDVYLPAFLGVLQLLHNEDILAKPVKAYGEVMTCKELRESNYRPKEGFDPNLPPEAGLFAMMMPPNPAAYCPTLFGRTPGQEAEATIGDLANRIREYREQQKSVVEAMNNSVAAEARENGGSPPIRFHFIQETGDLTFGAKDIAQDCFHLSIVGQTRVADAVLTHLQN